MIGIRGGINKWGESAAHQNSIKTHMSQEEDVFDSDLDVDLSQFENKLSIRNLENIEHSKSSDDSQQIKYNPLANLFNKGQEFNKSVITQNPLEQNNSGYGSEHLNYNKGNLIYNENHITDYQNNYKQQFYDNKYIGNYGEYNDFENGYNRERIYSDNQDVNDTNSQYFYENENSVFPPLYDEKSKYDMESPTRDGYRDFTVDYNNYDQYEGIRVYRKTRRQRNQESKLGQKLNRSISDSSYDDNHKSIPHSFNHRCDEIQSLPDSNSKYFKLSMTTIPPSGNSLPPLPEPDYDISDATFYIPPPDY